MTQIESTLPGNRAFVVQFRAGQTDTLIPSTGRMEHIVAGQVTHFQSWGYLLRCVEQILAEIQAEPP